MDRNVRASSILVRGTKSLNQKIIMQSEKVKALNAAIVICILALIAIVARPFLAVENEPAITYDSVNLHIQYKGCVVADKHEEDGTYMLVITNKYWPLRAQYKTITVSQHIYTNLYFIGDTIK